MTSKNTILPIFLPGFDALPFSTDLLCLFLLQMLQVCKKSEYFILEYSFSIFTQQEAFVLGII